MSGFLAQLVGGAAAQPIEAVGNVLDKLFTSDDERLSRAETLAKLASQAELANLEIAKVQAAHRSAFVAGGRPAIMWVMAAALLLDMVIAPMAQAAGYAVPNMSPEARDMLVWLVGGLAGFRTTEKIRGVSR